MTSHIRARKDARILYPSRPEERKKKPRFLAAIMDPAALEPAGEDQAKYCVLLYDDDKDDEKLERLQLYMNDKLSSVGECNSKGPRWFSFVHHADKHHTRPLDHLLIRSEHILRALASSGSTRGRYLISILPQWQHDC